MNGIQTTGLVLAVLGCLAALASAAMGAVSFSGSTGYGGPSGSMMVGSGNLSFVGLGVAAIGVVLLFVGKDKA